jgi:hypothetical protein
MLMEVNDPKDLFCWFEKEQYGYYPVPDSIAIYDEKYFANYERLAITEIGHKINNYRINLTNAYVGEANVLDIGIGCGYFLGQRKNTWGFDVNPLGVKLLKEHNKWVNPYSDDLSQFKALTFFDSFEHIKYPQELLSRLTHGQYVVMSIPLFEGKEHILRSKHFKPEEHYHYFTHEGLVKYMAGLGFGYVTNAKGEMMFGREDIHSYVFLRSNTI